ncbi:FAD-dependent oxidoreductase [Chloroflexota bacterium]
MSGSAFSNLFRPVKIGSMTVKNRIAMAPMGTTLWTEDGLVAERTKAYYEARARGGAGMVIIENASVDFYRSMYRPNRPTIDSDLALPGLAELVEVIKKHGAKAVAQLNHSGRIAKSKLGGFQPVAPSPTSLSGRPIPGAETPRQLSIDEIHEIVNLFAQAAVRTQKAGFDGVEVHAAHYYLISQFLSPVSNMRQDQYGGSLDNRARFLVEVLTAARKLVGQDYPLWCRLNGQELGAASGITLDDSQTVARMLHGLVDALSLSAYGYGREALTQYPDTPGALLPLAAAIKKVVAVPVIAVGRLTPEVAEQAIKEGKADIAAIGRGLIADPELPGKTRAGKLEDIRPCITCFHCIDTKAAINAPLTCAVNGVVGRESELEIKPAKDVKRIAIIGGGPAGMEAARVLSLRGYKPVLLEKEDRLGGQINLAMVPPCKRERLAPLLMWFLTQLNKLNVEVRLNVEADVDVIRQLRPDAVILAAGAVPVIPQLPGVERRNVVTAMDILAGCADAGHKTVIIGGGSIGCETAEFLQERGKKVTVVEMLPELAGDMGVYDRFRMLNRITSSPIIFRTGTECRAIVDGGVVVSDGDREQTIAADTVVLAAGTRPNNTLFPLLRAAGVETRMAGDCWHAGKIAQAVYDGLRLGSVL